MALNAPYTPNTTIQSTQVSNDLTGLANGTNDTTNNSMSTFRSETVFDHVNSGCVWSGDSYAVTRNASQTSGVVYIAGVRLTVAAVAARLFTASKDTYIDINGSGVQVYTEATNNAASPALAAGSIRIGIIITGATTIAAATSVNQGQETMVLPIASSIAYSVTDSLGNLICSRDWLRKVLGYRQIVANFSTASATQVQVTGLSVPVMIPTNRKVKITVSNAALGSSGAANISVSQIWDGVVVSGAQVGQANTTEVAGLNQQLYFDTELTPSATSKTYNAGTQSGAGTLTWNCSSLFPSYIKVELA